VLKVTAIMMGACEKFLHAAYERHRRPPEKLHQPWIDDCVAQATNALAAVDAMIGPKQPYLLLGRLTHADVTAFVAEQQARVARGIDTGAQMPRLRALTRRLAAELPSIRPGPDSGARHRGRQAVAVAPAAQKRARANLNRHHRQDTQLRFERVREWSS
jgi:glutathione S-transferase